MIKRSRFEILKPKFVIIGLAVQFVAVFASAQAVGKPQPSMLEQMIPFLLIFVVMWFFLFLPQRKRAKAQDQFTKNLKKGDEVLTASGILGKIEGLTDRFITLEISDGVRIRILRTQVASLIKDELKN